LRFWTVPESYAGLFNILKRFYPYFAILKEVKHLFALAVFAGVGYGIATGFGLPFMLNKVLPNIFGSEDVDLMKKVWVVSLIPLSFVARGITGYLNTYYINYCGAYILEKLRTQLFDHFQVLPHRFFQKRQVGDLISRSISDSQVLQENVTTVANDLIKQPVTFLGAIILIITLAIKKPELAYVLGCLALIPVCILPIRHFGKKIRVKAQMMQETTGALSGKLSENLSANREIRAFNLQEKEKLSFRETIKDIFSSRMKVIKYHYLINPTVEIITSFGIAVAILYASLKHLSLEDLSPVIMALYLSYEPIKKLGSVHTRMKQALASMDRIEEVLIYPVEIEDPASPVPFDNIQGRVEFRNLTFQYEEKQSALNAINLTVEPGEVVAMVGPSGAGKTTFANLLLRYFDPTEGHLLIDGIDIRNVTQRDLRNQIAYVPQNPILFNETVRNNILIGKTEASNLTPEEAAVLACAKNFIEELPDGFDTRIGEKGSRLSGGQIQRIAIARALLRNAPILILDEATSALDSESESDFQEALQNLIHSKTVFIIAHRFSTISLANRILVFNEGNIIADGPHETIIETCDLYRRLHKSQSGNQNQSKASRA
jgi:subfamily B ATP-binding cassette protein MsbA